MRRKAARLEESNKLLLKSVAKRQRQLRGPLQPGLPLHKEPPERQRLRVSPESTLTGAQWSEHSDKTWRAIFERWQYVRGSKEYVEEGYWNWEKVAWWMHPRCTYLSWKGLWESWVAWSINGRIQDRYKASNIKQACSNGVQAHPPRPLLPRLPIRKEKRNKTSNLPLQAMPSRRPIALWCVHPPGYIARQSEWLR